MEAMGAPLLPAGSNATGVDEPRRRRREFVVVATLAIAYALTVTTSRNALFTAKGQIKEAFGPNAYGNINSVGYATYGVGKLVYGSIVDLPRVGGRVAFVYCLVGTGLCTTLMSWAKTEEQFMVCWGVARATQASGWIAMIKIVTAWTPAKRLGRVMAGCNLSSYLGDFATRLLIGGVLAAGADWRAIFWMSGATIAAMLVVTLALVRPSPESVGMAPVGANRHSVVIPTGSNSDAPPELSCSDSLRLLCGSAEFWVVMLLSVCLQTAREAFNTNSADLLATQGSSDAVSAALSAAFPLMGVPACGACREAVSFTLVRRMLAFDSSVLISAVLVWPQFSSGGLLTTTIVDETERSWRFR
jgi:sugar phosphate permease